MAIDFEVEPDFQKLLDWTKEFVNNMQTHENTDGKDETQVEFCFDPRYIAMHDCYSVTYPNGSAFQAWRAGFREGVKMCLNSSTLSSQRGYPEL